MIDRLSALIERFVFASHDDPLVIAVVALLVILVFSVLVGIGLGLAGLLWIGRPWTMVALAVIAVAGFRRRL